MYEANRCNHRACRFKPNTCQRALESYCSFGPYRHYPPEPPSCEPCSQCHQQLHALMSPWCHARCRTWLPGVSLAALYTMCGSSLSRMQQQLTRYCNALSSVVPRWLMSCQRKVHGATSGLRAQREREASRELAQAGYRDRVRPTPGVPYVLVTVMCVRILQALVAESQRHCQSDWAGKASCLCRPSAYRSEER